MKKLLTRREIVICDVKLPTPMKFDETRCDLIVKEPEEIINDCNVVGPVDYLVDRDQILHFTNFQERGILQIWAAIAKEYSEQDCVVPRRYGPLFGPEKTAILERFLPEAPQEIKDRIISFLPSARKTCKKNLSAMFFFEENDLLNFLEKKKYCPHNLGTNRKCATCYGKGYLDLSNLSTLVFLGDANRKRFIDCCFFWVRHFSPVVVGREDGLLIPSATYLAFSNFSFQDRLLFAMVLRDYFCQFRYQNEYVMGLIAILTHVTPDHFSCPHVFGCRNVSAQTSVSKKHLPGPLYEVYDRGLLVEFCLSGAYRPDNLCFWSDRAGHWIVRGEPYRVGGSRVRIQAPVRVEYPASRKRKDYIPEGCGCCARDFLPR